MTVAARRRLRAGDRVCVVAPAGPLPPDLVTAGVARLAGWGLDVSLGAHVRDRHPTLPYLAGTDTDRAADLRRAWCDPGIDAVFCARGGYGSLRLLDLLDWPALAAARAKPLIGSSDATALLHVFAARLGAPCVFGPMVATNAFATDTPARERLRRCLCQPDRPVTVTGPDAGALVAGRTGGVARGVTAGGNASMLASLAGSPGAAGTPPPDGSILLLEDVTEDPYRLDRIITQLARAGWLTRVAGIALGSWTRCGPPEQVRTVLADRLADLGVPVAWGLTFGHCAGQASVPLGVPAELDADTGRLTIG
ncbi:MAG TPA: LD-carboxypeptidase [Pseudonocardiaceae bacterium]|nr:LD-carboxypeptidase [Pseudonocardiaceae bacterium]